MTGVQVFFANKGVVHDDDKLRIVGGFIRETNTLAFYANGIEGFIGNPWSEFKTKLLHSPSPQCGALTSVLS
jgi:hypothetical protein